MLNLWNEASHSFARTKDDVSVQGWCSPKDKATTTTSKDKATTTQFGWFCLTPLVTLYLPLTGSLGAGASERSGVDRTPSPHRSSDRVMKGGPKHPSGI